MTVLSSISIVYLFYYYTILFEIFINKEISGFNENKNLVSFPYIINDR